MAKYKISGHIDVDGDIIELEDDMTEEEVEQEIQDYVNDRLDWGYERIDENG